MEQWFGVCVNINVLAQKSSMPAMFCSDVTCGPKSRFLGILVDIAGNDIIGIYGIGKNCLGSSELNWACNPFSWKCGNISKISMKHNMRFDV